jgi:hypothetical protein
MPSYQYHRKFRFLVLLLISGISLNAQSYEQTRRYDSAYYVARLDSLTRLAGENKADIPVNAVPVLLALSHYPDLAATHIRFKSKKIRTTMNCRPTTGSLLFRSRSQRRYVIRINSDSGEHAIRYDEIPFNAAVGLAGHEIAHILDYSQKSICGVSGRGFAYLAARSTAEYEKEIDMITISRGFGWQLYAWSRYIQDRSHATEKYKAYKRRTYLGPEEILKLLPEEK